MPMPPVEIPFSKVGFESTTGSQVPTGGGAREAELAEQRGRGELTTTSGERAHLCASNLRPCL